MSANRSVSAVFTSTTPRHVLTVTVSPSTGGTVARSPNLAEYETGTVVTLTATPASGYEFTRWEGDASGTANPASVTMDAGKSVTAVFTATAQYTLTVTASPPDGGTVTRAPDRAQYDPGTVVTLTATPASGFAFSRWDGGLTGTTNPATVAMSADRSVTAIFTETDTPIIRLSPTSLFFSATRGEVAPAAETVGVMNGNGGTLSGLTRSYPDGKPDWLTATLGGSVAPTTLTVQVSMYDRFGRPLAAGTYASRVAVTSTAASNSPQFVAVTFTILSETTLTAFAAFDNTVMASSHDAQLANTVFFDTPLAVGNDYIGSGPGTETIQAVAALLFDVQSQIAGRNIVRATLRLFVHTPRGDLSVTPLVRVSAFASLWNPATLTWNAWQTMQVQVTGTAVQDAPSSPAIPVDLDVTTIVRNWASSTWNNHGLQIDSLNHSYPGATSLQTTRFQSLEQFFDLTRRPQLIIEFQ
ncbi:MAG: DNRLRE domain-containing protein [Candidatus Aminicenantes bacterium]|nr:DNRLRE domain-containing protein [Candidatus Aminicenantes bacterium]